MNAAMFPCSSVEIKVEPWTKERLRALGRRCFDFAAERSREMFLVGRGAMGCEWGSRLPRIENAIASIARLPYETGKDVDALGALFSSLMEEPKEDLATLVELAYATRACCTVCGRVFKSARMHHDGDGAVCCSRYCAKITQYDVPPGSIAGVTRAILEAMREVIPVGISPRFVIATVADHLGIGVDPDDLRDR